MGSPLPAKKARSKALIEVQKARQRWQPGKSILSSPSISLFPPGPGKARLLLNLAFVHEGPENEVSAKLNKLPFPHIGCVTLNLHAIFAGAMPAGRLLMAVRKRITTSGDVRWQVDYRDGNGVRRHRQFPTKREADAFHVRAHSEVTAGIHTPDSASITVAEATALWLARCERDQLEPTTIVTYRQYADLHILPYIGPLKLARLTVPAVTAFRDRLLDNGRSPDMVKRVLKSLGTIVGEAQARGLVATNNVRAIAKLKRERRAERIEMPSRPNSRRSSPPPLTVTGR